MVKMLVMTLEGIRRSYGERVVENIISVMQEKDFSLSIFLRTVRTPQDHIITADEMVLNGKVL